MGGDESPSGTPVIHNSGIQCGKSFIFHMHVPFKKKFWASVSIYGMGFGGFFIAMYWGFLNL